VNIALFKKEIILKKHATDQEIKERNIRCHELFDNGWSMYSVEKELGISRYMMNQVISSYKRKFPSGTPTPNLFKERIPKDIHRSKIEESKIILQYAKSLMEN
jgi:hypothetical protein